MKAFNCPQCGASLEFERIDSASVKCHCESFDKLHVYEPDGRYLKTLKTPHAVDALTFDSQNNLYVAGGHKVSKLVLDEVSRRRSAFSFRPAPFAIERDSLNN